MLVNSISPAFQARKSYHTKQSQQQPSFEGNLLSKAVPIAKKELPELSFEGWKFWKKEGKGQSKQEAVQEDTLVLSGTKPDITEAKLNEILKRPGVDLVKELRKYSDESLAALPERVRDSVWYGQGVIINVGYDGKVDVYKEPPTSRRWGY